MIIRFQKSWNYGTWDMYAFEEGPMGARMPFRITLEALPAIAECAHMEPTVRLPMDQQSRLVSALLEGLAEAGLIPQMGATEAELKSARQHLADMRALVFESVPPKKEVT